MAKYVPMCQSNKIPAVGFYSGPDFATEPVKHYVFAVRISNQEEEHQFVQHMWNDCKFRKLGIIYQNDAYGASHLEGMRDELTKFNAQIVGAGSYTRKTDQVAEAYNKVKAENPEVVNLACVPQVELDIAKMAAKDNWHPLFFINSSALVDNFLDGCGKDGDGMLAGMVVPPPSRGDLPLIAEFQKSMKKYYPNERPRLMSLQGFIDAMVFCEGLKRAGKNLTREKFIDALESIHNQDVGLGKRHAAHLRQNGPRRIPQHVLCRDTKTVIWSRSPIGRAYLRAARLPSKTLVSPRVSGLLFDSSSRVHSQPP